MRDIRFRIWDDCRKDFIYKHSAMFLRIEDGSPVWYERLTKPCNNIDIRNSWPEHLILQQYTGCRDKDGREIYEGDLLRYKDRDGRVEFFAGMFICSWDDQTDDEIGYMVMNDMEIVGNIFEGVYPSKQNVVKVVEKEEENLDLSYCPACEERAWDGYICHICGAKQF